MFVDQVNKIFSFQLLQITPTVFIQDFANSAHSLQSEVYYRFYFLSVDIYSCFQGLVLVFRVTQGML